MPATKCPLCESPCIVKIVTTQDEKCEVDVCRMCGAMYPREGARGKAAVAKAKTTKVKRKKG